MTEDPPFESKLKVRVLASHLAYRVKSPVFAWVYGNEIAEPENSALSNQPRKLYPSRVVVKLEAI